VDLWLKLFSTGDPANLKIMNPKIVFFPVDNGDMTLIELESGKTILIDTNIRESADDPDDDTPDVASMLRGRLHRDTQKRLCVDVFILSHPDQDHCRGLINHCHLGAPEDNTGDKIFIREIWSSPMVFRRASNNLTLCEDAKAFSKEAKRRVQYFRDHGQTASDGNRILILGEDENGKTDDLGDILIKVDEQITTLNGSVDATMTARLLGPLPKSDAGEEECILTKNNSSVIIQFSIACRGNTDACRFLTGGDAEVAIWERLWQKHKNNDWLTYHLLQTPHHCSWHTLSYDSWSKSKNPQPAPQAVKALSQALSGALIVASCKPILDDDCDPPCIGAKRIYQEITNSDSVKGEFLCTGEYPSKDAPDLMEIEITKCGILKPKQRNDSLSTMFSAGALGRQPHAHG
jgi:hypothetical protein